MSVLKSEMKQLVTHEVGVRVEDALEGAKRDLAVLEGRQGAFADGAKAAEALLGSVDKDIDEEKYDPATGEHVKRYVLRCAHALANLSANAANLRIAQTGKVQGFQHTVSLLQNMIEAEKAKVAAAVATESLPPPENPRDREAGTRPVSIKELRLAEEAAPKALPEAAPPKRRGRKPRAANS
jgi:hypothetical protein